MYDVTKVWHNSVHATQHIRCAACISDNDSTTGNALMIGQKFTACIAVGTVAIKYPYFRVSNNLMNITHSGSEI
jgi:hypothetical protein